MNKRQIRLMFSHGVSFCVGAACLREALSLYNDCPPARAWWQRRIAEQAANNIERESKEILALFQSGPVWETLSEKMASRLTVIGDVKLRDGVIAFLLSSEERFKKENLLRGIGVMSAWRGLGIFSPQEIKGIIDNEIVSKIASVPEGNQ